MDVAVTMNDFNVLLRSEEHDNALVEFVRRFLEIEKPADVRQLHVSVEGFGWR